jgi:hypothetical protein
MCDCYYPEVFNNKIVRARKPYQCSECRSTIVINEKHHSIFGVWDHEPGSYRVCADCEIVREWLLDLDLPEAECCLGTYGDLYHELVECDLISFERGQPITVDERLELLSRQENGWKVKVREAVGCS